MLRDCLLAGLGAALGSLARWGLGEVIAQADLLLLAINIAGSAAMGWARPGVFWGKGVLGGVTSFSAFALVLSDAPLPHACAYGCATIVGAVGAWVLGDVCRQRVQA
ncbi:fluoride efflux transporter family protein [Corynebacterium uberis]|uniref:fluoride efflux transporter family protein n=1 Tax=Corynebacterium TaxID=1716 RepID=UPI001D0B4415|nr:MULTISPECIES: fluoride efflux transporter family protein [Corynebacterium]MCZ9310195.1 fluoride efflux transporter family protein [Corynebacterium sp. c6VSa_13]UDL75445.1 fluoride efflux transporter family protein [Corynebacterium uberis]UDL77658.1 fluoride efflux transporter family protein [Corynebacterium uberis]UDL79943.1 fluoride efflux transporter family protein [Corynebacterium uberis]UDL84282.1 fluoride efflux transporter family protein [Corynebacterium uberis]